METAVCFMSSCKNDIPATFYLFISRLNEQNLFSHGLNEINISLNRSTFHVSQCKQYIFCCLVAELYVSYCFFNFLKFLFFNRPSSSVFFKPPETHNNQQVSFFNEDISFLVWWSATAHYASKKESRMISIYLSALDCFQEKWVSGAQLVHVHLLRAIYRQKVMKRSCAEPPKQGTNFFI